MEFLSGLWAKLNKPIHFLLVWAAISLVAPTEVRWVGYVLGAFGMAGTVEWLWKHAINPKEELQRRHTMHRIISYLNDDDRKDLQTQVKKREQTSYLNWNDYHGVYADLDDADEYRRLAGIYRGLAENGGHSNDCRGY